VDMSIQYPSSVADWFAKGHFSNGAYFEVPAVFLPDGTCDVEATKERIDQFEQFLIMRHGNLSTVVSALNQGAD